ncbi:unnamed protein product [Kuraishia capsulata CBS 1993]|uniref:Cyclin-like domain-containing protein n=1 Tax=Kuraishia capsulata CBS 1993 TaxID=1382522 RepID=W6ML75_9ASCO|nr:uncharacterized protein KUCA_T00002827001 [Kuraishia capsulata CBS 1993]CDK26853.1 unnamed protein product [Kuraishia capsulata CBS 1993]
MQSPDEFHLIRRANTLRKSLNPRLKRAQLSAHFAFLKDNMRAVKRIVHESNRSKLPKANYLVFQPEISERERFAVVDFIHKLVIDLGLDHRVFFTAINLIDRYCHTIPVMLKHLEVLALSCIWIASKFHSRKSRIPEVSKLCGLTNGFHNKEKIIKMESTVLNALNWDVNDCTYDLFIDTILQGQVELSVDLIKYGALYLCELAEYNPGVCMEFNTRDVAMESVFLLVCVSRQWMPSKLSELGKMLLKMASNPPTTLRKIYDPSLKIPEYEGVYLLHRFCCTYEMHKEQEKEQAKQQKDYESQQHPADEETDSDFASDDELENQENLHALTAQTPPQEPKLVRMSLRLKLRAHPYHPSMVSPVSSSNPMRAPVTGQILHTNMTLLPTPRPSPVDELNKNMLLNPETPIEISDPVPSPKSRSDSLLSKTTSVSSVSSASSGSSGSFAAPGFRGHAKRNSSYMDVDMEMSNDLLGAAKPSAVLREYKRYRRNE